MISIKKQCNECGGQLEKMPGKRNISFCLSCGSKFETVSLTNNETLNYLDNAELKIQNGHFSEALEYFEGAIEKDPMLIEGYWGALRAKYGIQYVFDAVSETYKPTCNSFSYTSILEDDYYLKIMSLKKGDSELQNIYKEKAAEYEKIRLKIGDIIKNEEPFDIFISYKRMSVDDETKMTTDREIAKDIYHELDKLGYKVFFSEVTLEKKGGLEYEPIIFNALRTSKLMLLVAANLEHIRAPWVMNEWKRFLHLMKEDSDKQIIVITSGIERYALPPELSRRQAMERNDINFKENLLDRVRSITSRFATSKLKRKKIEKVEFQEYKTLPTNIIKKRLIKQATGPTQVIPAQEKNNLAIAYQQLRTGDFKTALMYFNTVISNNPNSHEGYWGRVLTTIKASTDEDFDSLAWRMTDFVDFEYALENATTEKSQTILNRLVSYIKSNSNNPKITPCISLLYNECIALVDDNTTKALSNNLFAAALSLSDKVTFKQMDILMGDCGRGIDKADAGTYVNYNYLLAEKLRGKKYFSKARRYYGEALKINPYHQQSLFGNYLNTLKIARHNKIKNNSIAKRLDEVLDSISKSGDIDTGIFDILIDIAILRIRDNQRKVGMSIFEKTIQYIQTSQNDYYGEQLVRFSNHLLLKKKFKAAKKYYLEALSINSELRGAHWGLLKVATKTIGDIDLLMYKGNIATFVEFNNTVNCRGEGRNEYMKFLNIFNDIKSGHIYVGSALKILRKRIKKGFAVIDLINGDNDILKWLDILNGKTA